MKYVVAIHLNDGLPIRHMDRNIIVVNRCAGTYCVKGFVAEDYQDTCDLLVNVQPFIVGDAIVVVEPSTASKSLTSEGAKGR